jgi:hypothetical protein
LAALAMVAAAAAGSGCAQTEWVKVREVPANPLAGPLQLLSPSGPQPTDRTRFLLRRYDLEADMRRSQEVLSRLHDLNQKAPSTDKLYSISELAYLAGKRTEPISRRRALELHGVAAVNAYHYLFDARFGRYRNPYDPEFRGACDLYNSALEGALRIVKKNGGLVPGTTHTIRTANQSVELAIVLGNNTWRADDFEEFRFASDYEIQGLQNQYHNYGLGVPLIAVRKHRGDAHPEEKFYPPGLSFPVTAFMRVFPERSPGEGQHVAQLELYDPLNTTDISVDGRRVPLESDLTTPLAYSLNQKDLRELDSSTTGLLNPAQTEKLQGLYMLEPYQPDKIPVLMIHGLWSSPITWMAMFNDLRGAAEIRRRYQFWFYLYPTGKPFWHSALALRRDLAQARHILDPEYRHAALDKMVLVGHSMGGLVSHLQTIESGNDFWNVVSDKSFQLVKASQQTKRDLGDTFFFRPNPAIRRVITIGTPFRGSKMANSTTRWLGSLLIEMPQMLVDSRHELEKDNPDFFRQPDNLIDVDTSIDSLAPDSPMLPAMLAARRAPWVTYHNVVGHIPDEGLLGRVVGGSDGVVSVSSAHLDGIRSEIEVDAHHSELHFHPLTVLEVHRILLEHLAEVDAPQGPLYPTPYMASAAAAGVPPAPSPGVWAPNRTVPIRPPSRPGGPALAPPFPFDAPAAP